MEGKREQNKNALEEQLTLIIKRLSEGDPMLLLDFTDQITQLWHLVYSG